MTRLTRNAALLTIFGAIFLLGEQRAQAGLRTCMDVIASCLNNVVTEEQCTPQPGQCQSGPYGTICEFFCYCASQSEPGYSMCS
jgi:hypothetical protein